MVTAARVYILDAASFLSREQNGKHANAGGLFIQFCKVAGVMYPVYS
jgi:hypothetical protein